MLLLPSPGLESPLPRLGWVSVGLHCSSVACFTREWLVCEMRFLVDSLSDWGSSSCSWFPVDLHPEWAVNSVRFCGHFLW